MAQALEGTSTPTAHAQPLIKPTHNPKKEEVMKTIIITTTIAAIATLTYMSWGKPENLDSAKIEREIRKAIRIPSGDIPVAELATIKRLALSGQELSNIGGVTGLSGLEDLNLNGNQITDVGPAAKLGKLVILDLGGNHFSDLTPLENLHKLNYLNLENNHVKSLGPLANLKSLSGLILSGNKISDITPLLKMKSLRNLNLKDNPISKGELKRLKKALPKCIIHI